MEREKPTFDILGRIERERLSRGWSEYALAENSGLTQSTISTWRRRNLQPNVASLEKICSGLGISLSQFFQEEDSVYLTPDQKEILDLWAKLSPAQRNSEKEIVCEPVKAPLWHKHKRNGPCIISLNCCLGVRQSPFLRLCGSRHTFIQNSFGRWCADG